MAFVTEDLEVQEHKMDKEELYEIAYDILEMDDNLNPEKYEFGFDQHTIDQIIMRINYIRTIYKRTDKSNEKNVDSLVKRVARLLPGFLLMEE